MRRPQGVRNPGETALGRAPADKPSALVSGHGEPAPPSLRDVKPSACAEAVARLGGRLRQGRQRIAVGRTQSRYLHDLEGPSFVAEERAFKIVEEGMGGLVCAISRVALPACPAALLGGVCQCPLATADSPSPRGCPPRPGLIRSPTVRRASRAAPGCRRRAPPGRGRSGPPWFSAPTRSWSFRY